MFKREYLYFLFPVVMLTIQPGLSGASKGLCHESGQPAALESGVAATQAAADSSARDKERYQADVVNKQDLPNFHEVHPFLFRSGEPTEKGLEEVKGKGVRTLIDLRGKSEKTQTEEICAKRLGLKYINLPMSAEPPAARQVDLFLKTVKKAASEPAKGSVLVHCAHGSDRTGCLVGIWRVTQDGWTYDDAYSEMRKYWFTPKFTRLSGTVRQYWQKGLRPVPSGR